MAEDWLADVVKYAPDADPAVVEAIVRYCGIALQNRDSSLVSFGDAKETGRVRDNFLKKKLALMEPDAALDGAIAAVGERMKADRTKNRVTVYYLLADHFGKLGLFGGSVGLATMGAPASDVVSSDGAGVTDRMTAPTPLKVVSSDGAGISDKVAVDASTAGLTGGNIAPGPGSGGGAARFADVSGNGSGGAGHGWLVWLLLALIFVLFFLALRSYHQRPAFPGGIATATMPTDATTTGTDGNATLATGDTTTPAPAGAGVIAGTRADVPMLTVYFDTGKAAIADGFAATAAPIKDYVAAHPGTKLAVSGYNDASGNAAANALLSKNRAKAVQAALTAAGVPAEAIVLEKPADTTAGAADAAAARRVEVTVKP